MKLIVNGATYTKLRGLSFAPETDITCASLPVNEFSVDVNTKAGVIIGENTEVLPDEELEQSPDGIITVGVEAELRDDLDQLWAKYWIVYAERIEAGFVRLRAQSKLCLLDRVKVPAAMYNDEVGVILTNVLGQVLGVNDYAIDGTVAHNTVSGYCPEQTVRERVLHLCLAAGLFAKSFAIDHILFSAWPTTGAIVPMEDTFLRPMVTYRDHVTAVRARSYSFTTGTPQQGDESVEAGGVTYIVTAQDVTLSNPTAPVTAPVNIIDLTDCMLIHSGNVDAVLSRLSQYHFQRLEVEADVLNNHQHWPGDKRKVYTGADAMAEGYVQKLAYTFGVQAKARMTLVGCSTVACAALTVLYQWDGVNLGKRVYCFPVGYAYSITNPYLDKTMNRHRYVFRPTTASVSGTMTSAGASVTVQYAVALDAYTEQGKRILHVLSVDSLTESTVGEAAVVAIG